VFSDRFHLTDDHHKTRPAWKTGRLVTKSLAAGKTWQKDTDRDDRVRDHPNLCDIEEASVGQPRESRILLSHGN
jgi:hypothetical protein